MKKALALVLALVLALSLGVSAFALDLVILDPAKDVPTTPVVIESLDKEGTVYVAPAEGGEFYFQLKDYAKLKDIKVENSGIVSAEIVKFNPETMVFPKDANIRFFVVDNIEDAAANGNNKLGFCSAEDINAYLANNGYNIVTSEDDVETAKDVVAAPTNDNEWADYETAAYYAYYMRNIDKTNYRFEVKAFDVSDWNNIKEVELNLVKVTVAENYSASYKEGSFKISAYNKVTKKAVSKKVTVISDVTIFEYEMVKWAAAQGALRAEEDGGYSDYETAMKGYTKNLGADYDYRDLRKVPKATVVPTTAFRAIVGEDLVVCAGDDNNNYVVIYDVAKGQKGVNFAWHGFEFYNAKGKEITDGTEKGKTVEVKFGFYGNQTIASDFEVVVTPGITYNGLRELFGEKVEEEDIITYYVLKDGKVYDSFTVDYADVEVAFAPIELEIKGKAGDTLGEYSIVLEAPSAPSEGEENPNTGAESVIGVVAAMAVVSVAAAAAVSLKK